MQDKISNLMNEINIQVTVNSMSSSTDLITNINTYVVKPKNFDELKLIVELCNNQHIRFHVISRGHNWGYGDRNTKDSCELLIDLSLLNKILSFDDDLGTLEIEPGVTQDQVYQFLLKKKSSWVLDITGADKEASIVGNFIERGFGHTFYGDHENHGKVLEILTSDGKVLSPHFLSVKKSRVRGLYQHDLSLNFEKIFYQTNFAVVTKFLILLKPKNDITEMAIILSKDLKSEFKLIKKLSFLKQKQIINSIPHIANAERIKKVSIDKKNILFAIAATVDISGTPAQVKYRKKAIKDMFGGYTICFFNKDNIFLFEKILSWLPFFKVFKKNLSNVKSLYSLMDGVPSNYFIENSIGIDFKTKPQKSIWICPLFSTSETDYVQLKKIMNDVFSKYNFPVSSTISLISDRVAICVLDITVDPEDQLSIEKALTCYNELTNHLFNEGYPFYRMGYARSFIPNRSLEFETYYNKIKSIFDPNNLISPDRWMSK